MSKLDKFLILIIIINLFASIFIIFGNKKEDKTQTFEIGNISEFAELSKNSESTQRYIDFIETLTKYRFNRLYSETKDLSDEELKEYYNKNNTETDMIVLTTMESNYGISDYDTFYYIVGKMREIKEKGAIYKSSEIVRNSCKIESDYISSKVIIKYNKFQKITLTIEMANTPQYDTQEFKISVEEGK